MTRAGKAGRQPATGAFSAGDQADRTMSREPVIVLSYPHAGAGLLTRLLSASPSLACTTGAGLLPLCHSAARIWQQVEGQGTIPSALALKSIRTMVGTMAAVLQSQTGARRWCETAYAPAAVAETFLRIFPAADFLIVHRSLRGVLTEAAETYSRGPGHSPSWSYAEPPPGNDEATIASYWTARANGLLRFQAAHPHACLRIRYEDLATDLPQHTARVLAHLRLPANGLTAPDNLPEDAGHARAGTPEDNVGPVLPRAQLPSQLLAEVRDLHSKLDYAWP